MKKWFEKLGKKVIKTMAQTALGMIPVGVTIQQVGWLDILSASVLAGIACILMNLADIKE